jgi:Helix-turn-helix domain
MSFQAVTWAIEQKAGGPSAKATLWSIANYANDKWCAWPSQDTICRESEQSPDSVQRRIPDLEELGLIRRIHLRFEGRKAVDFFILRPSPFFDAELPQIEPLLPRGHSVYVESTKSDAAANAAADSGHAQPQTQPQPAANAAASCGHKKSQLGTEEPSSSSSARAEEGHSSEAEKIADEIAKIAKVDEAKHGKWFQAGPAVIVQRFLDAGYLPWQLIEGVKRAMATRTEAPRDIHYFKPLWQRVRAEAETPAPMPEMGANDETVRNGVAGRFSEGKDRDLRSVKERRWAQAWDNVDTALGLARSDADRDGAETGEALPRGLPEPGGA